MSNQLTVGELFGGIGGIGLGLERAGMEILWMTDNNPYACSVYRKNFPDVEVFEHDIRYINFENLPSVDLLAGGFPCQDISYAGINSKERAGIHGERSGLWRNFWKAIRTIRPKYVLVENVFALRKRGLDVVLGDLASIGYDAEWDCIRASDVGAWHRRKRIFIIAYPVSERNTGPFSCVNLGKIRQRGRGSKTTLRLWAEGWMGHASGDCLPAPFLRRTDDGVPGRMDRIRCLGNAVVPQVSQMIGEAIIKFDTIHG